MNRHVREGLEHRLWLIHGDGDVKVLPRSCNAQYAEFLNNPKDLAVIQLGQDDKNPLRIAILPDQGTNCDEGRYRCMVNARRLEDLIRFLQMLSKERPTGDSNVGTDSNHPGDPGSLD